MAKRADRRYASGRVRDWVKVKRYRTIDCIVIGLAGDLDAPKLVLGLRHPDCLAHHFGVTRALPEALAGPYGDGARSSRRSGKQRHIQHATEGPAACFSWTTGRYARVQPPWST